MAGSHSRQLIYVYPATIHVVAADHLLRECTTQVLTLNSVCKQDVLARSAQVADTP
jgi:hypothetical protein